MRKLWIGTETIRFVAGHRDRIDALAFAIMIKQERRNSLILNATQRNLKKIFHVGADKLRRLIRDGERLGFLRWYGKSLIANKVCQNKHLGYIVSSERFFEASTAQDGRLSLSLTKARNIIEEAIIVNQVSMQDSCKDTHNRATAGTSARAIRSAQKRERRMLRNGFCDDFAGLSNIRIQQLIDRKHKKAIGVVKDAIRHGLISKHVREKELVVNGEAYNAVTRHYLQDTNVIVWVKMRSARIRRSNEYRYHGNNIKKVNHGA